MATEIAADTMVTLVAVILLGSVIANATGYPFLGCSSGGSMQPILGGGNVVLIDPTVDEVENGDVVVYEPTQTEQYEFIAHRVVNITERGYITKGAANSYTDQAAGEPAVKKDRVVGKPVQIGGRFAVIPFPNCSSQALRLTLVVLVGLWLTLGLRPKLKRWLDPL